MKEPALKEKKRFKSLHRGHIFYAALVVAGLFLIGFAITDLLTGELEYSAARSEYESLREFSPVMSIIPRDSVQPAGTPSPRGTADAESALEISELSLEEEIPGMPGMPISDLPLSEQADMLAGLKEINPDFVGWIYIEDVLDYPVVRGRDNERYLDVTFQGRTNPSGAIFMDYRNKQGFFDPVCVLYGHNMRNGTMFKPLHKYSSRTFLEEHNQIIVVTLSGEVLYYRIFAARYEESKDLVYELSLSDRSANPYELRGAPDGASHFLILSTCTNDEEDYGRLHVYAALEG